MAAVLPRIADATLNAPRTEATTDAARRIPPADTRMLTTC
jgi:hypothetical protein